MEAKGKTGEVSFDGRAVVIRHHLGNVKTVPLKQIGAVSLTEPKWSRGIVGSWSLSIAGEVQSSKRMSPGKLVRDENTIVIDKKHLPAFKALTDAVNAAILDL